MYISNAIKKTLAQPYKLPLGQKNTDFVMSLINVWYRHGKALLGAYDPLTRLATTYQTDKGKTIFPFHGYTTQYHRLFKKFRNTNISILEIGLARTSYRRRIRHECPSLSLWLDYFPRAKVFGFDIDDFTAIDLPRTCVFQGDQGEPEDLLKITKQCDQFNIIIDDGSHASYHQQTSLKTLFPFLAEGGLYVVEDLHNQPERLENSLPVKWKTREAFKNPRLLDDLVNKEEVGEVLYFDSESLGGEGEMGVIRKAVGASVASPAA